MTRRGYQALIDAPDEDRLNIFLETAMRLGTPVQYIEKLGLLDVKRALQRAARGPATAAIQGWYGVIQSPRSDQPILRGYRYHSLPLRPCQCQTRDVRAGANLDDA